VSHELDVMTDVNRPELVVDATVKSCSYHADTQLVEAGMKVLICSCWITLAHYNIQVKTYPSSPLLD